MADITKIDLKGTVLDIKDAGAARSSDLAAKQDALVSGTNIKTVNSTSLLGSGDISIPSGTTPHIDSTTGNWFLGTTDTGVHAQGATGSVTLTDGDLDSLTIVNDLTTGGSGNILSAEMGKKLKSLIDVGYGSFSDAWVRSQVTGEKFTWILNDTVDGVTIRKPIYHVGGSVFIDAVGAVISLTASAPSVPTFDTASGSSLVKNAPVGISFPAGSILHYIINSVEYTASVSPHSIPISSTMTIEAWAVNAAGSSSHVTSSYTVTAPDNPVFDTAAGALQYGTNVSISFQSGATLYYKLGSASWATTTTSPLVISVTDAMTIQAYVSDGTNVSDTVSRAYTIAAPDAPTISEASGAVDAGTQVTITWSNGALHYTINSGTEQVVANSPTTITINSVTSLEAWVVNGGGSSTHVSRSYTLNPKSVKITASDTTTVTMNNIEFNLSQGVNTIALNDIDTGGTEQIASISWGDITKITAFNGGGATFTGTSLSFNGASNLVTFTGLLTTSSLTGVDFYGCAKMATCDMSGFVAVTVNTSSNPLQFRNCAAIETLDLSWFSSTYAKVRSSFYGCTKLKNVIINYPSGWADTVTVFTSTTNIEHFIILSTTVPTVGANTNWVADHLLAKSPNAMIGVPSSALSAYQADTVFGASGVIDHLYAYDAS